MFGYFGAPWLESALKLRSTFEILDANSMFETFKLISLVLELYWSDRFWFINEHIVYLWVVSLQYPVTVTDLKTTLMESDSFSLSHVKAKLYVNVIKLLINK